MHANLLDDKILLITAYNLINLYIFNVLTKWIFLEMNCQVYQKMTVVVTVSDELPMVVSKIKWNLFEIIAA